MLSKQAIQTFTVSVLRLKKPVNCTFLLYSLLLSYCSASNRNISVIIHSLSWISSYHEYKSKDMSLKITLQTSSRKELQNCDLFFFVIKFEVHCLTEVPISP